MSSSLAASASPLSIHLTPPTWTGELSPEERRFLVDWCGSNFVAATSECFNGSYSLKHNFGHVPGGFYCMHEDFGAAMLEAGFRLTRSSQFTSFFAVRSLRLPPGVEPRLGFALRRAIEGFYGRTGGGERRAVARDIPRGWSRTSGALWLRYCEEAKVPMVRIEGRDVRAVSADGQRFAARAQAMALWAGPRLARIVKVSRTEILLLGVPKLRRERIADYLVKLVRLGVVA